MEASFDLTTMGYIEVGCLARFMAVWDFRSGLRGGYSGRVITDASRSGLFNLSALTLAFWWKPTDYPAIQYLFACNGGVTGDIISDNFIEFDNLVELSYFWLHE